jgi:hypothetical protein
MEIAMSSLPPFLKNQKSKRSVCLILEGFEEYYYFKRLIELPVFSSNYKIKIINAKSAGNIPAKYQEALASDSYYIVLVVCDLDRRPDSYDGVVRGIEDIIGDGYAYKIITFTRPCTLQVILYHFGDAELTTQAKTAARDDVFRLTGIEYYDAHQDQLEEICRKIFLRSWDDMIERLRQLSTEPDDMPSSNMIILFEHLCSDDISWIDEVNSSVF